MNWLIDVLNLILQRNIVSTIAHLALYFTQNGWAWWSILLLFLREKIANLQSKLVEQATAHETKEASLVYQLHNAQKQHRDVVNTCKGG